MSLRTVATERCPVWFMMQRSLAPVAAAPVASPVRRLCPPSRAGFSPAAATRLPTRATALSKRRPAPTRPRLSTGRKSGPAAIPAAAVHARPARAEHVAACRPIGMPTGRPPLPGRSWNGAG